jgi:hypothetical protein
MAAKLIIPVQAEDPAGNKITTLVKNVVVNNLVIDSVKVATIEVVQG